jgi:formate dehydrogenase subunit beta
MEEHLIKYDDIKTILITLLKEKIVSNVISGEVKKDHFSVSPKLVSKPEELEDLPLSQLIAYNYARTDSASKFLHKSANGALDEKIALIARPCDTRAIIELTKLHQINPDNLFIIGIEDMGIIPSSVVSKIFSKRKEFDQSKIIRDKLTSENLTLILNDESLEVLEFNEDFKIADNCLRCIRKVPVLADLSISDIGISAKSDDLILRVYSEKGKSTLKKAGIKTRPIPGDLKKHNAERVENIIKKAKEKRKKDLEEWKQLNQEEKLERLQKCTMCGLCIRGCPVCYCVDCILTQKRKDKTINNVTYQLTRVAHVADRCVECGNCANNCPQNLPLSEYFQSLIDTFKEKFNYKAGESIEDIPFRSGKAIKAMELEKTA